MVLDILMIIAGITLCFFGIYLVRLCSGINGFVWGAITSLIIMVIIEQGWWNVDEGSAVVVMIIFGGIIAVIAFFNYRICAAISGFLSTLTVLTMRVTMSPGSNGGVALLLIIVVPAAIAYLSWRFYDYAFIIISALSGGVLISVGFTCLSQEVGIVEMLLDQLNTNNDSGSTILGITAILGFIGTLAQLKIFSGIKAKRQKQEEMSDAEKAKAYKDAQQLKKDRKAHIENTWLEINENVKAFDLKSAFTKDKGLSRRPCKQE